MIGFVSKSAMICLVLIFFQTLTRGQSIIQGTVRCADTGEPLSGATIVIKPGNLGTVSDPRDYFSIQEIKPDTYILEVNYLGYRTFS
jgi:iron complex outermembrane receptor protein